jgi:hypothetical protein
MDCVLFYNVGPNYETVVTRRLFFNQLMQLQDAVVSTYQPASAHQLINLFGTQMLLGGRHMKLAAENLVP